MGGRCSSIQSFFSCLPWCIRTELLGPRLALMIWNANVSGVSSAHSAGPDHFNSAFPWTFWSCCVELLAALHSWTWPDFGGSHFLISNPLWGHTCIFCCNCFCRDCSDGLLFPVLQTGHANSVLYWLFNFIGVINWSSLRNISLLHFVRSGFSAVTWRNTLWQRLANFFCKLPGCLCSSLLL